MMRMVFAVVMVSCSIGCVPRSEKDVVLYTSADREFAAPILDAFERANDPTTIVRQYDVESTKTVGLVTRILEEKKQPRCDVFWNNEIMHTIRLQQAGVLRSRRWPIPSQWPSEMKASDGTWVAMAGRARILLINVEKLSDRNQWPNSVEELSDPKWKGKCGLALPLFGTTTTHCMVLAQRMGQEKSEAWFREVQSNAVVLSGNKQVAQAVSSGQLEWGLTDTDDALVEKENGMKVDWVFPDQLSHQMGTLMIPNTVAVIDRGPHPIAAGKLADYLVSKTTEERLTTGNASQFSVWPGASKESAQRMQGEKSVRWMQVDFEEVARGWDEQVKRLRAIFAPAS